MVADPLIPALLLTNDRLRRVLGSFSDNPSQHRPTAPPAAPHYASPRSGNALQRLRTRAGTGIPTGVRSRPVGWYAVRVALPLLVEIPAAFRVASFVRFPLPGSVACGRSGAVAGELRNKLVNGNFFRHDIIQTSCGYHPALWGYQVATRGV